MAQHTNAIPTMVNPYSDITFKGVGREAFDVSLRGPGERYIDTTLRFISRSDARKLALRILEATEEHRHEVAIGPFDRAGHIHSDDRYIEHVDMDGRECYLCGASLVTCTACGVSLR